MQRLSLLAILIGLAYIVTRGKSDSVVENIKEFSDRLLEVILRVTSQFEGELSTAGQIEQDEWRRQQARDVHMRGGPRQAS